MREISWQVRVVARVPDGFPQSDEPTNTTIEYELTDIVFKELRKYQPGDAIIEVRAESERLDK